MLRDIVENADSEAVEGFGSQSKPQGHPRQNGKECGQNLPSKILSNIMTVLKQDLIGTAEQVADQIIELKKIGVDIVLTGFLHYEEDLRAFGEKVIPLVREKELVVS